MSLASLEVVQVRNLTHAKLEPSSGINLIFGANASGKTSLLESVSLLALARSFRTSHIKQTIQHEKPYLRVTGKVNKQNGVITSLGVERSKDSTTIRIAGKSEKQASQLAVHLPVMILGPDSHSLIEAGPRFRRQFLDWGVFHVEHQFLTEWKTYHRALRQRNAALRNNDPAKLLQQWDEILVQCAIRISEMRQNYLNRLLPALSSLADQLLDVIPELRFHPGWPQGQDYAQSLANSLLQDRALGYTQHGPHRADIRLEVEGRLAQRTLSRGQQKLLICAMRLAQVMLLKNDLKQECLMLVDDLAAELDAIHRARLLKLLVETQSQLFITATEAQMLDVTLWSEKKMFHVEHGKVKEVVQY